MPDEVHIRSSSLYNKDLAPTDKKMHRWGTWNYAALWISMSLCIPTYMLASSLIEGGMNWKQAIFTIFLGNTIVLLPMILNGHAGTKYGIPFPVFARASFGVMGANIPALLRAIVACGWFGIQAWIGGKSIYFLIKVWKPALSDTLINGLLPGFLPLTCFLLFWVLNMFIIYLGIESIRKLLIFKAFFLPLAALALLSWAILATNGLGAILKQPSGFKDTASFLRFFFPALTGMVGFWATLSLNIPDFTRYAKSQKAQINGQALGLPASMTFFAFVGVVVTSATTMVFGTTIWDPVVLAGKFSSKIIVSFAMIAIAISTLATNIAANIVSPANDFANLAPSRISFKTGGYITGILGLLILPWKLAEDPGGYIFTWLVGYSSLLGPIGGIMIADYFFIRRRQLVVDELYKEKGVYTYWRGFNIMAVIALLAGIVPNIPGFLLQVKLIGENVLPVWLTQLYHYAWFVGFLISGVLYLILMKGKQGKH